jgi:hypothetical protein
MACCPDCKRQINGGASMKHVPRLKSTAMLVVVATLMATTASANVIFDWNAQADAIVAENPIPNVRHARGLSMLHVAMFEAVNAVEPRYAPYALKLAADRGTSKEAAAAVAGYEVLVRLYPGQKAKLDVTLAAALSGIPDTEGKAKGVSLGRKAAAEIVALREDDGNEAKESYRPHGQPGVWVPTVVPLEITGGLMKPWVMTSASQFRPAPPPALDSATWTRDVNEIREMGGAVSAKRSPEQTAIARFWFVSGPRTYNPIARQVAVHKNMDLLDSARLFALVSMAGADAFVAVFDAKYAFNLWRPMTAIRNADLTNNPATPRDASWMPLGTTPMHPEYPCAHCIASSTVAAVLQRVAGDDVGEISLTSPMAPGITRKWTKLQDYRDEVANARTWSGFHYRFSNEVAKEMGRKIGELTVATQLRGLQASAQPAR